MPFWPPSSLHTRGAHTCRQTLIHIKYNLLTRAKIVRKEEREGGRKRKGSGKRKGMGKRREKGKESTVNTHENK